MSDLREATNSILSDKQTFEQEMKAKVEEVVGLTETTVQSYKEAISQNQTATEAD